MNFMNIIPEDVLFIIFDYIPMDIKKNLSKQYFNIFPLSRNHTTNYMIKNIIRNDYHYLLDKRLKNKYNYWKKLKNWRYKGLIFQHYIEFLKYFIKENNSQKCKETLIMYNGDSSKKKYKRIHIKNIRWTN